MNTLPNELHLIIARYLSNDIKNYTKYCLASKTTKCIMDSFSIDKGFSSYLEEYCYNNSRCNTCKTVIRYQRDFFGKKFWICSECNSGIPKLSETVILKEGLLDAGDLVSLHFISTVNQYKVRCHYYLKSDVDELTNFLFTSEEIEVFYNEKEAKKVRRIQLKQEKNDRENEISSLFSGYSENLEVSRYLENDVLYCKYIAKNIPKNKKKKEELIEHLRDILEKANETIIQRKKAMASENYDLSSKKQRRKALNIGLSKFKLRLRQDSKLCANFIEYGDGEIDYIVNRMCEMKFLFDYCDISDIMYTMRRNSRYNSYYGNILDAAEEKILRKMKYPVIWPWMK